METERILNCFQMQDCYMAKPCHLELRLCQPSALDQIFSWESILLYCQTKAPTSLGASIKGSVGYARGLGLK